MVIDVTSLRAGGTCVIRLGWSNRKLFPHNRFHESITDPLSTFTVLTASVQEYLAFLKYLFPMGPWPFQNLIHIL